MIKFPIFLQIWTVVLNRKQRKRAMKSILIYIFLFTTSILQAQISPPGMGDIAHASWFALGLKQSLNESESVESMTYLGLGYSKMNETDELYNDPAIIVINQEFYHQLNTNWKLSYAASYRNQWEKNIDLDSDNNPREKQREMRLYSRISYTTNLGKVRLTQTARQEARKFVDENWKNTENHFQLRSRLKTQAAVNLDEDNQHALTAGAEVLFSTSKNNLSHDWSKFKYKESRFTFFYTYHPKETPIAISLGYMNNLIKNTSTHSVHYASFDVVWENPFHIFS